MILCKNRIFIVTFPNKVFAIRSLFASAAKTADHVGYDEQWIDVHQKRRQYRILIPDPQARTFDCHVAVDDYE